MIKSIWMKNNYILAIEEANKKMLKYYLKTYLFNGIVVIAETVMVVRTVVTFMTLT